MSYVNGGGKFVYDVEAVRNGTLLVGNDSLVPSGSFVRRYTSRGVEDSGVLKDRFPALPVRDLLGTLAAYAAGGKLPPNW